MKKTLTLAVLAVLALGVNGAWADGPFPVNMTNGTYGPVGSVTPNSGTGEFEIYDAVNLLLGTTYTNNAQLDSLEVTGDTSTWEETGNGAYAVIGLGAGNSNSINVYNTATPGTLINPLGGFTGNGATGNGTTIPYPGTGAVIAPGAEFGFAITSTSASNTLTWYSNPALNSDGMDHMLVYNLSSLTGTQITIVEPDGTTETITLEDPYLLAFEDTSEGPGGTSDEDYNDLLVLVNGVAPVPEPVTVALFGLGLLAMAAFAFRRKFAFLK